ncbi:NADH-cytochrome B5 reductase [Mycena sanguinolenta]|uniref:NADH-cytochrome B5 reductase n=1 Tax=Mycena sanguinolenta TaxID=230812 RepID=A0A8H6Y9H0_9AGAR|nr:NADH-cytochrome B5 reductase [Mycena sanguinolenta]
MDDFGFSVEVKLTDEEWDRYLGHKRRWCELQPLVESRGYRLPKQYRPEHISAWDERPKGFVEEPHYPHLVEGTRISDNRPVMLKFTRTDLWEATIFEHLSSIPDEDNHTIPLYDVITPPSSNPDAPTEWCIVVTPRLTDCKNRHFDKLSDFIDFVSQVLEGVCFMHRYNIAHTDVARTNIVWDARKNLPDPKDPKGKGKKREPARIRYYFIDFGLACSFSSFEDRGLVKGVCGQHRTIPELSEDIPYDPFALDIRQIGEMLKRDYLEVYLGLDFLDPWMARLRDDDPAKRPTAEEALAEFRALVSTLPEDKLKARVAGRTDWPFGRRVMIVLVCLWMFLNGLFLWWNWHRPVVLTDVRSTLLSRELRGTA